MTGVGAAVVADDEVVLFGEEIDDLALGLVAPLQADDTGTRVRSARRHETRSMVTVRSQLEAPRMTQPSLPLQVEFRPQCGHSMFAVEN
jgi:hypothetical protein